MFEPEEGSSMFLRKLASHTFFKTYNTTVLRVHCLKIWEVLGCLRFVYVSISFIPPPQFSLPTPFSSCPLRLRTTRVVLHFQTSLRCRNSHPLSVQPIQFRLCKNLFISSPRKSNPWLFLPRSVYSKLNFICHCMVSQDVLPIPLNRGIYYVTWPVWHIWGWGVLFCAWASSSLRGKLPQKFPHSRNVESGRLIVHVRILYSGLHSASDERTVGSEAQWSQLYTSRVHSFVASRGVEDFLVFNFRS